VSEERAPALTAWVREFVAMASSEEVVAAFVGRVDDAITAQIPEIAGDPILVQDLHSSTGSQWRAFLAMLDDDYRLVLPDPAYGLALSLARRGMDLGVLLKVYRVANQAVFTFLNEIIEASDEDALARDEVLVFIWARAGRWMDDAVEALIETFVSERQRLYAGAVARRAEVVEALLGPTPPGVKEAEKGLGHALQHWQTAWVVWADAPNAATAAAMAESATTVAQGLGAPRPLTVEAGSRDLWCWAATPAQPDLAALGHVEAKLTEHGLRVAVGMTQPGVAGFRSSHAEARAAQALSLRAAAAPRLVSYADVELLCLVADQPALMSRMVAREVGPLAGADKNLGLLRETVLTHLKTLNVEATAELLFVHKNTVRYRIARAEELLGHPLAERSTAVELALEWIAYFGVPTDL
jgi:DNA-binding PucR family transcriptional regulator